MLRQNKSGQTGQVLLIVILVIIVTLTIGLSLASRTLTSLRTSTEEADSQKALAAAEAGIEKALQDTVANSGFFGSTSYDTVVVEQANKSTFLLNGGSLITQGEGADVWFAEHNPDGTVNFANTPGRNPPFFHLFWGAPNEENCDLLDSSKWPAAIEVIVVSGTSETAVSSTRHVFDLCDGNSVPQNRGNDFEGAELISGGIVLAPGMPTFMIRTPGSGNTLISGGNLIFMRVVPIYKGTVIGIRACNNGGANCTDLPSQGFEISSTGTTTKASRKITVFKGHKQSFLPYISYVLFVPTRF